MLADFRKFIARGNALDLAVGVIIGAAFGSIVKSLTDDILMPVVSAVFGGVDFSSRFIRLGPVPSGYVGLPTDYAALKAVGVPILGLGAFLTTFINFLILAFLIFLLVRFINSLTGRAPAADAGPTERELLAEIRDELRRRPAARP